MRAADLDFDLPPELIAQEPAARREDARLLLLARATGEVRHAHVPDLVGELRAGDLLVVNDTRVLPARLLGRRASGGRVELLLVAPVPAHGDDAWEALVRCGGALQAGEAVTLPGDDTLVLVTRPAGGRAVVCGGTAPLPELMRRSGRLPLPPYIRRDDADARDALDRERYQTVYAERPGAIAAPTAGLHLTQPLLDAVRARGVGFARVTLHVGPGTFLPVRADDFDAHVMHAERFDVPEATAAAIRATRAAGGRVVAVGTTTVRALEAAAAASADGLPQAGAAETALFIRPGHTFRAVDALWTNFHLPRSTLLCLVAAFAGRERVLAAYRTAVAARYRFFSYGDAMLIA